MMMMMIGITREWRKKGTSSQGESWGHKRLMMMSLWLLFVSRYVPFHILIPHHLLLPGKHSVPIITLITTIPLSPTSYFSHPLIFSSFPAHDGSPSLFKRQQHDHQEDDDYGSLNVCTSRVFAPFALNGPKRQSPQDDTMNIRHHAVLVTSFFRLLINMSIWSKWMQNTLNNDLFSHLSLYDFYGDSHYDM